MMRKSSRAARLLRCGVAIAQLALVLAVDGCGPRGDDPPLRIYRDEVRFGLSFEERMAIPPQLSRLRAEAQRRADEVYDPFRSREDAAENDAFTTTLYDSARVELMKELELTDEQLEEIVREYQASLGGNLR